MTPRRSLYSRPDIVRGEQCTTGALLAPTTARRGAVGVVADIAKLSVGREEYYTRELATDHQAYLSGHGESPGRWYGTDDRTVTLPRSYLQGRGERNRRVDLAYATTGHRAQG
jgi:hypothetical protein